MANNILRFPQVLEKTGLRRSTVYLMMNQGNFPKKIQLSPRTVGFLESEIDDWLAEKVARRGGQREVAA